MRKVAVVAAAMMAGAAMPAKAQVVLEMSISARPRRMLGPLPSTASLIRKKRL
jgi:hypothetical protein